MTSALSFTDNEAIITYTSRLMEEDRHNFVAIGGPPLLAILLARQTHAPKIAYVVEDGTIAPEVPMPAPTFMVGAGLASRRAVAWTDMNTVDFHAMRGYVDYGVLAAVQVDQYGNFNSTYVGGDFDHPMRRFGGPGGANEIASLCWRTILMTRLQRRKFVRQLDFMSSPGYLDGTPRARERAGMPAGTGPYRVVTESAVFGFDDETRRMMLLAVAPWTTPDEIRSEVGFELAPSRTLEALPPPTERELDLLRTQIDPSGRTIAGDWILLERAGDGLRRSASPAAAR
jgi:glutaconate CoA-transferase subunit B